MHGDMKASTKELARTVGVKTVTPCSPENANRHTGYVVGSISPFGTRRNMPVNMEETICELDQIYVNGGRSDYLVGVNPKDVINILQPKLVKVGITPLV